MKFQAPASVNGNAEYRVQHIVRNHRQGSVLFDTLCLMRLSRARLTSSILIETSIAICRWNRPFDHRS